MSDKKSRMQILKEIYKLQEHSEGGWFAEVYTASFKKDERAFAGSIYFLLCDDEISHFHQIDCEELWYYHEGCGMKITLLNQEGKTEYFLGNNLENNERFMIIIPKGTIFAAENLNKNGFTFVSCVTTPKFMYEGFRLVNKNEICEKFTDIADEIKYLAVNAT